jgi:hypothetical protein
MLTLSPARHHRLFAITANAAIGLIVLGACSSSSSDESQPDADLADHRAAMDAADLVDASNEQRAADALPEAGGDGSVMPDASNQAGDSAVQGDGGSTAADGGSTVADGGSTVADGGSTAADGGSTAADGGSTAADGGSTAQRDGSAVVDANHESSTGPDASSGAEASACAAKPTATVSAHSARSAGFSGDDTAYSALYNVACQTLTECVTSCVAAGGTNASCTTGSECIAGGLDNAKHCLPPTYWRSVAGATSESGTTSNAAEQTLVVINYQDPLAFTGFGVTLPDDAQIVGVQFAVRKNADDGFAVDDSVRALKDGTPVGVDHHQPGAWSKDLTYVTYGGPTDTWGVNWQVQDIRAQGFGLSIAARYTDTSGNDRAHIDSVRATVFYRTACN